MKTLKGLIDRGLVWTIVQRYAAQKGIDYEEAHKRLTSMAEKIGWERPETHPKKKTDTEPEPEQEEIPF